MPDSGFLTGLTGDWVNAPRAREKPRRPVRPVRKDGRPDGMTGSDGSAGYIGRAPAPAERKAADSSDPSGTGSAATVVLERARPRNRGSAPADVYHLAASRPVRIGYVICAAGEPLCGTTAPLQSCPDALFLVELEVTCWVCALIAERDHITIAGGDAA